jgi:hypothetical protein
MLIAFNGDPDLKAGLIKEVHAHRVADRLVHGTYGESGNGFHGGCAVGCSIESYRKLTGKKLRRDQHENYEEFGIPRVLARLEDGIFEGLPRDYAQEWPEKFFQAIPVGADLSGVWSQFAQWLLVDAEWGVIKYIKKEEHRKVIQRVADLYAAGDKATMDEFLEAARACREVRRHYAAANAADAAANAADAAANAANAAANAADAAANAANAAANAAYAAAANAANAAAANAANAAAYANANAKARTAQANKLMELLYAAPVPRKAA